MNGLLRTAIASIVAATTAPALAASPAQRGATDPTLIAFDDLASTELALLDAAGNPIPYVIHGVHGHLELPDALCDGEPCRPYHLVTDHPLAVDAQVGRVPLHLDRALSVPGRWALERGVAVRHATAEARNRCRVQLALDGDPSRTEARAKPALVYTVDAPCAAIVARPPLVSPRSFAGPPAGFRPLTVVNKPPVLTLAGEKLGALRIELLALRPFADCDGPHVYGKRTGTKLEVMIAAEGQWVRGRVPASEVGLYASLSDGVDCIPQPGRVRVPRAIAEKGRLARLAVGTALRARDFDRVIGTVTAPVRVELVRRERGSEIVRWVDGVDYLCLGGEGGACTPGLFVRDVDATDEVGQPASP